MGTMRRIVYLPPILLTDYYLAVAYRQRIAADPCHTGVLVLFREDRREKSGPLTFPLITTRDELHEWKFYVNTVSAYRTRQHQNKK